MSAGASSAAQRGFGHRTPARGTIVTDGPPPAPGASLARCARRSRRSPWRASLRHRASLPLSIDVRPASSPCGTTSARRERGGDPGRRVAEASHRLAGSSGRDRLIGGKGDDKLTGGKGNDRLSGGSGNDTLSPGAGHDAIDGGPGNDTINSVDGVRETVICGSGRDTVRADRVDRLRGCEKITRVGRKTKHKK